jgi:hypothetical protein
MRDFWNWVKVAGPSVAAGACQDSTVVAEEGVNGQAAPRTDNLKKEVTNRLGALVGPYKDAVAQDGPTVAQMKTEMDAAKKYIVGGDFEKAAKALDRLEPLVAGHKTQNTKGGTSNGTVRPTFGDRPQREAAPAAGEGPGAADGLSVSVRESIQIEPRTATIPYRGEQPFKATRLDETGTPVDITFDVEWKSDFPEVTVDAGGVARAERPVSVTATVTARDTASGDTGTATLTIAPPPEQPRPQPPVVKDKTPPPEPKPTEPAKPGLQWLTIRPTDASGTVGDMVVFSAWGSYADGSQVNLTSEVDWSTVDVQGAKVLTGPQLVGKDGGNHNAARFDITAAGKANVVAKARGPSVPPPRHRQGHGGAAARAPQAHAAARNQPRRRPGTAG